MSGTDTTLPEQLEQSRGGANNTEETALRLHEDVYQSRERGTERGDRAAATVNEVKPEESPYRHIGTAGAALREVDALKDKKPDEKIQIQLEGGQIKEVTVAERRKELMEFAEKELKEGIRKADALPQEKITTTLWENRTKQSNAKTLDELEALKKQEMVIDELRTAPAILRFAMATMLTDQGRKAEAKEMLDQVVQKDPEARSAEEFKTLYRQVSDDISGSQGGDNPFFALQTAEEKRAKGDFKGAEADYKAAMTQADNLDPKTVQDNLTALAQSKKEYANDPEAVKKIEQMEQMWQTLGHAQSLTRMNYAEFLVSQNRGKEAVPLLERVKAGDPELVKDNKDFDKLLEVAKAEPKKEEPFENPFEHMDKFRQFYEKGDLANARFELEAMERSSKKIDRKLMQENKKVVDEQIKEEKDPQKKKELEQLSKIYDELDHSHAMAMMALGRFELADKHYTTSHNWFERVQREDAEFAKRPDTKMDDLLKASVEPSTWEKVKGWAGTLGKELLCDAVAIAAGAGTVILTGWSGPLAIGAGAVAGAAAYTFMKGAVGTAEGMADGMSFGDAVKHGAGQIHWYTPIWGAVDGASGGLGAIARTALVKTAGGVVSREMAEATLLKTGGRMAGIEGVEGMRLAATTEKLAAEGLKDMGKGLGFWERTVSRIPGTGRVGLGNAEFREALNANRKLWAINRGTNFAVDAGTAGTVSLGVRGSHEAVNYYEGRKTGGEALKSLAFGVATDSATGGFLGTIGRYGSNQASGLTRMDLSSMRYSPAVGTSFAASAPWMYNAYQAHQAAGSFGEMRDSLNQPVESTAEFKERFEYEPNAITPEQIAEHAGFEITPQMKEDAARREAALKRQEEQRLAQSNE